MDLIYSLVWKFAERLEPTTIKENNSQFTASFSISSIKCPTQFELLQVFGNLLDRDTLTLCVEMENQEVLYCSKDSVGDFINNLESAISIKENDEYVILTIEVQKSVVDQKVTVISLDHIVDFWSEDGAVDAIRKYENLTSKANTIVIENLDSPFYAGDIYFTNDDDDLERYIDDLERSRKRDRRDEVAHFSNDSNFNFIPEDFSLSSSCQNQYLMELFEQLKLISSLVFMSDFSTFDSKGGIHFRLNGYRLFTKDIPGSASLKTLISSDYYKIYQWVYGAGNVVDKIGLARNIITLHVVSNNLCEIEDNTITSIESGFQIYLKENVSKYIEVKNKLSDHIQDLSTKAANIVSSLGSHLRNSMWTMYSFFATVFLVRLISNQGASKLITNEVMFIFLAFAAFSLATLYFAFWEARKEIGRFKEDYFLLKKRYKDLMDPKDLNKILDDDAQHRRDLQYIIDKSYRYVYLWIFLLTLLGGVTACFWWHGLKGSEQRVEHITEQTNAASPEIARALNNISASIEKLSDGALKMQAATHEASDLGRNQPDPFPYLALLVAVIAIYLILKVLSKEDSVVMWLQRGVVLIGLLTGVTSLIIMIDNQWYIIKDKPEKDVVLFEKASSIKGHSKAPLIIVNSSLDSKPVSNKHIATFFIPFEEASCKNDAEWVGVSPSLRFERFISTLAKNISFCSSDKSPVILDVRGFSSSSEMRNYKACEEAGSSDEANLKIANARRDNVVKLLSENAGKWVEVRPHFWKNGAGSMMKDRGVEDRTDDMIYNVGRGSLNRRVEISVLELGDCTVADSKFLSPQFDR